MVLTAAVGSSVIGGLQASPERCQPDDLWKLTVPAFDDPTMIAAEIDFTMFAAPVSPTEGPRTHLQRLEWAQQLWDALEPLQRDVLCDHLRHASWVDHFSGIGCRTQMVIQICKVVADKTGVDFDSLSVRAFTDTEIDTNKRRFTNAFAPPFRAMHEMDDITRRLGHAMKCKVDQALKKTRGSTMQARRLNNQLLVDEIVAMYNSPDAQTRRSLLCAPCCKHLTKPLCPVSPYQIDDDVEMDPRTLSIVTGGPVCHEVSAMGKMMGDAGLSHVATKMFVEEVGLTKPDICMVECTPRWPCALLSSVLEPLGYNVQKVHLCGNDVGDVYNRPRLGAVATSPDMHFLKPLSSFLQQAGSYVSEELTLGSFWCASPEELEIGMLDLRRLRGKPRPTTDEQFYDWDEILLESHARRLVAYGQQRDLLISQGKMARTDDFICDLDQNPEAGRGRSCHPGSKGMMTFTRHGTLWHWHLRRPLLGVETMRVHCWPIETEHIDTVGAACSVMDLVRNGTVHPRELHAFVGDSWHLRVQGLWLMWVLSNVINGRIGEVPRSLQLETPQKKKSRSVESPGGDSQSSVHPTTRTPPSRDSELAICISDSD